MDRSPGGAIRRLGGRQQPPGDIRDAVQWCARALINTGVLCYKAAMLHHQYYYAPTTIALYRTLSVATKH